MGARKWRLTRVISPSFEASVSRLIS